MKKILVVDDDLDICSLLQRFLSRNQFEVATAYSGHKALELLRQEKFDLVLSDYRLNDMDGKDLLPKIKEIHPNITVIVITAYSDVRVAVNIIKSGAYDYVTKPLLPDEILLTINKALEANGQRDQGAASAAQTSPVKTTRKTNTQTGAENGKFVLGESKLMHELYKQIELVAGTNYSVIILGESGTGKELVANTIHKLSPRANHPFVAMDCGALNKELALSELFGHEKGSFTGAVSAKMGHFEIANGGTLFLDEVANLSYETQVALLRVIQERKVKRIGSNKEIDLDVRIIVASNENLNDAYLKGRFREDLYHRFNQFSLYIPPLRDRGSDVLIYARHFLNIANGELNKQIAGFSDEVNEALLTYKWPGNLRELKNVINRAALLTDGDLVQVKSLPPEISNSHKFDMSNFLSPSMLVTPTSPAQEREIHHSHTPDLKAAAIEAEQETIMQVLKQVNFNKTKAAALLNIDRKTLYNKMKNFKM